MATTSSCPDSQHLRALVLGHVNEADAAALDHHLAGCTTCQEKLRRLAAAGDTRRIRPADEPPPADDSDLAAGQPVSYPFLGPPARPDELGRLGNYRVLRQVGRGGMGMVFLAEDIALCRPVALKVMSPDLGSDCEPWQRFLREARTLAAVKNQHVVTIFQAGQEGQAVYLAMEFLEGLSLETWLRRGEPTTVAEVLRLGREIATGLAAIHQHGLVHRDIKPGNIWLEGPDRHVKLLDFGLARSVDDNTHLTSTGVVVGTPAFMSPEQARGNKLDLRSDLFSLGCVLYALCTGVEPFRGKNTMAQLTALATTEARPVHEVNPAIPESLSQLIQRLLAKRPEDRLASAREVVSQLRALEKSTPQRESLFQLSAVQTDEAAAVPATLTQLPAQPVKKRRKRTRMKRGRRWKTAALLGLAVLGLLAGGILVWSQLGRPINEEMVDGRAYLSSWTPVATQDWPEFPLPPEGPPGGPPGGGPPGGRQPGGPDRPPLPEDRGGPGGRPLPPPPRGGDPRTELRVIRVQGKLAPYGIGMHASPRGAASASYRLGKRYDTFHVGVSVNDSAPHSSIPLTFVVYGDGKVLWKSRPVQSQDDTQTCTVDVKNVDVLKLEVASEGDVRGAHGAWIDPYVTKQDAER